MDAKIGKRGQEGSKKNSKVAHFLTILDVGYKSVYFKTIC